MKTLTKRDFQPQQRKRASRKGNHGRVLVVGGSTSYVGAVTLAGLAALHNCDLVTVAAPTKVAWAINACAPDLMTVKLPGNTLTLSHYAKIKKLAEKADVLLFGNGVGLHKSTQALMRKLAQLPCKKVIDADGIKALKKMPENAILTPHATEYDILTAQCSKKLPKGTVIIKKGATDTIFSSRRKVQNKTGNPGMTKGGTGDVLAGLAAGYFTQTDAWHAACNAAYINGTIADALAKKKKYTYLASDLVREFTTIARTLRYL